METQKTCLFVVCEKERILYRRLTAFSRGRTLEAVEGICAGDGIERGEILDLLSQLVDKSLVTLEIGVDGAPRYTLLESMWDYCRAKLEASGELTVVRDRRAAFFARLALEAAAGLEGPDAELWMLQIEADYSNLRRAMERSRERPECAETAAQIEAFRKRFEKLREQRQSG